MASQSPRSDFSTLFGILAGFGLVFAAIFMAGGGKSFLDLASALIVFGGTFAITIACYSSSEVFDLFASIKKLVLHKIKNVKEAAEFVVKLAEHGKKTGILGLQNSEDEMEKDSILRKGVKLLVDGSTIEEAEQVIAQDIQSAVERNKRSAAILR